LTKGQRLLKKFETTVREHEFMHSNPPEDWDIIKQNYKQAKNEINVYIRELEETNKMLKGD